MRENDGKLYRVKRGSKPFILIHRENYKQQWLVEYVESGKRYIYYTWKIVPYEGQTIDEIKEQHEERTMLYQVKGEELYGTKLTTNSKGDWVLEMKGSGDVKAYPKDQLIEVVPYTVSIQYNGTGTHYHYITEEGVVEKGDYLLDNQGTFAIVSNVGTKSRIADKELPLDRFRKVVTSPLSKPIR